MSKDKVKIGPGIDKKLYAEFCRIAEERGHSQRALLEKALSHYTQSVVLSRSTVRPDVIAHFSRSTEENCKLHRLLSEL